MTLLENSVAETVVTQAVLTGQTVEKPIVGREALAEWIVQTHAAIPGLRFAPELGPLADSDLIALRWRARRQHGSARLSFTGTDMLQVENDHIVR